MRQRGLAQARRAEQQHVIQRLVTPAGGGDENLHLPPDRFLSDVFRQARRAQPAHVDGFF